MLIEFEAVTFILAREATKSEFRTHHTVDGLPWTTAPDIQDACRPEIKPSRHHISVAEPGQKLYAWRETPRCSNGHGYGIPYKSQACGWELINHISHRLSILVDKSPSALTTQLRNV
jgi:hypothetical protein